MAALVTAAMAKLWPGFLTNPTRLLQFKAAVATEVRSHAQASGALAQRQYRRQRTAAGETSVYRPAIATLPSLEDIGAMVDEALAGLDLSAPELDGNALADAKARLAKAAEDAVFDTGTRTILDNARGDAKARGYARIPEPNACAFCLMLATRGAVYKADRKGRVANGRGQHAKGTRHSTGDSFAASDAKFEDGEIPSTVKVHDNCRCHPEPVFTSYEPSARVRAADALWIAAAKGSRSTATKRFRQAVEGRIPADDPAFTDEQRALIARLRDQL
jgi:hypothetical protein